MLVLSRKKGESIVINGDITVTVMDIRGDNVRLGIISPRSVPVHRREIWDVIREGTVRTQPPVYGPVTGRPHADGPDHIIEIPLRLLLAEIGAKEADVDPEGRLTVEGGISDQ